VRIGEPEKDWRGPLIRDLIDTWPGDVTARICQEIMRPRGLLVGLNKVILRILLSLLAPAVEIECQSDLLGGHTIPAVSDDKDALKPISWRIAAMVEELGGDVYLSGPSGRKYLSEEPFVKRGITVEYWSHQGENPCALSLLSQNISTIP
jgi:hypothetical protein